jgi:hypothetical protein
MEVVLLDETKPALDHCVTRVRAMKQDLGVNDAAHTIEAQEMREANKTLVKCMHFFADNRPFDLTGVEKTTSHREKA